MGEKFELQDKIYKILVKGILLLSFFSIIGNLLVGLSIIVNIKWIFLFVTSSILAFHKYKYKLRFPYFFGIIVVLVPLGWIDAGGSIANSVAYVFLLMLTITFLFPRKQRNILNIVLLLTVFLLFYLEKYYPGIAREYDLNSQYYDRLYQIPLTYLAGFWVLVQFANAYIDDKNKLEEANEKLFYLASHDSLTEVYNRRAFDKRLEHILSTKQQLNEEIWIVLFDIDYFKNINDTFGHKEGDKIIHRIAMTAKDNISNAFISRWGGDEFCMIIYSPKIRFFEILNNFFENIRKIKVSEERNVTISAGVTSLWEDDDILSVFKRVDEKLYAAKKSGRDKYIK